MSKLVIVESPHKATMIKKISRKKLRCNRVRRAYKGFAGGKALG